MTKKDRDKKDRDKSSDSELTFTYGVLGTITLDEQKQAIWDDIAALKDEFGVNFLKGAELVIRATNEYGDPVKIRRCASSDQLGLLRA